MSESHDDAHPEAPSPRALAIASKVRWALVVLALGLAVLGALLGAGVFGRHASHATFTCPMHPEIRASAPGACPICQMDLVPLTDAPAAEATARPKLVCPVHPEIRSDVPGVCPLDGRALAPSTPRDRGVVHLGEDAVRRIGVVNARAERRSLAHAVRGLGLVATDPARTAIAQSRFAGFVTRLPVATPFARVRRGQTLASITSADLYRAEAELAVARATSSALGHDAAGQGDALLEAARARLGATGLGRGEIDRVAGGGTPSGQTAVTAPRAGVVLEVRVSLGEMVTPGMPLHVIADLSRLFVNVELSVDDAATVPVGAEATVTAPGAAAPITGTVALVEPVADPASLVRRVRVVVENGDLALTPGMRVDVTIARPAREAILVPRDAVLLDGDREHVFVARPGGRYEPRVVTTGLRDGDHVEIVSGLAEGEEVASVAAFLIDAESQIRGAGR